MKRFANVFFSWLLFTQSTLSQNQACECSLSSLSMNELNKYEIIFRGTVKTVKTCDDVPGSVQFRVTELYKGRIPEEFELIFSCDGPCAAGFNPGEEWIIYTTFLQLSNGRMDWCSRSRKYFKNEKEDYYAVNYGNDYFEEIAFLRQNLGTLRPVKGEQLSARDRNIRPSITQSVIILIVSLAAIVGFYWLFRKFFK